MKKINKAFKYILLLIGLIFTIYFSINSDLVKILTSISLIVLIYIPKIFKIKLNDNLMFIYYIYLLILLILGCLFNFYSRISFYDDIAHFLFGFASSIGTCYILKTYKMFNNIVFNIICIIIFTLGISAIWELFEYTCSIIFKQDIQLVTSTGVTDTMVDIIMALVGSIIFSIYYIKDKKLSWI